MAAKSYSEKMKWFICGDLCESVAKEVFRKQNGPQALVHSNKACGPPGGLFGIDQEVVTLRGLYGNSGVAATQFVFVLQRS
jgi:hypothetical protein